MSDAYLGEIRMFAGGYAPVGWRYCDGSSLAVRDYTALYSLIGNSFGGDTTNFNLPNMGSRIPVHCGSGAGEKLRRWRVGETIGTEKANIAVKELPAHTHPLYVSANSANQLDPKDNLFASPIALLYAEDNSKDLKKMDKNMITNTGGGYNHENIMPYLCISYIICVEGDYPPRP